MIKKEQRSKFLQKQLDDKEFTNSFNFIKKIKGLDSTAKLLLNEMCNDLFMNGKVTWAHQTYAERLGLSRRQVIRWFGTFVECEILLPDTDNKVGGKNNKYGINHYNIRNLTKPVTPRVSTCDTEGIEPVTPEVQTCDTHVTYNKVNKSNKDLLTEENILDVSSVEDRSDYEVDDYDLDKLLYQIENDI